MTRTPAIRNAPEASFDGTVLAEGALPNSEITQRIKEAMEPSRDNAGAPLNFVLPCWDILRCGRNQAFVSFPFSCLLFN